MSLLILGVIALAGFFITLWIILAKTRVKKKKGDEIDY